MCPLFVVATSDNSRELQHMCQLVSVNKLATRLLARHALATAIAC